MTKKIKLDEFERDIEDNFESLSEISDMQKEIALIKQSASNHAKKGKSITLRINDMDLEALKIKASKLGIPYQTYINMLIHKDATSSF